MENKESVVSGRKKIIKFNVEFKESLGTIYEKPVFRVHGEFDDPKDLEKLIIQISEDIREKVGEYLAK